MASALPERPDLEFEKKQAKALLKAYRSGDATAVARMQTQLNRLTNPATSDATLADAQFVLARERGFESWSKLKAHIESRRPPDEQIVLFVRAATGGKLAAARRVLAQNPDLVRRRFQVACAAGDVGAVTDWLAREPSIATTKGAGRELPLIVACASQMHRQGARAAAASLKCVELLLDHGADANTLSVGTGDDHLPALFFACMANNIEVVKLLLARGANVNDGESVHHSAEKDHRECLEILIAHGADISSYDPRPQNTVLFFLAEINARPEGIQWLLEHGADPNVPCGELANTPLHQAASSGNAALVSLLIKHGANVNAARTDGRTSYALAVRTGNIDVANQLRAAGARTDVLTPADEFFAACMRGDEPAALAILHATPGLIAGLTLDDQQIFLTAASRGNSEAVRVMLSLGFDPAAIKDEDSTALHGAAWWGRVNVVKVLLDAGAPVNVRDGRYGSSPIAWAAHGSTYCRKADEDYCAVVDALIDAGATYPESINRWNEPAPGMASRRVRAQFIKRGFAPSASGPQAAHPAPG
jgi:ankyrin repeat protein